MLRICMLCNEMLQKYSARTWATPSLTLVIDEFYIQIMDAKTLAFILHCRLGTGAVEKTLQLWQSYKCRFINGNEVQV